MPVRIRSLTSDREIGQVWLLVVLGHRELAGARLGRRDRQLTLSLLVGRPGELKDSSGDGPRKAHQRARVGLAALGHRNGE